MDRKSTRDCETLAVFCASLAVALAVAACSSMNGSGGDAAIGVDATYAGDASFDAKYTCNGFPRDAGEGPLSDTCVVGESFCTQRELIKGILYDGVCLALPTACQKNPSCSCLTGANSSCSCSDSAGQLELDCY